MAEPLGVVAGGGTLPLRVMQAASAMGRPVHVVVLEGHGDPAAYVGQSHLTLRWGLAAQMLSWLRQNGVREIVLAGNVTRPSLLSLRPDAASMKLIGRIGRAAFNGDDSILRAVMKVWPKKGLKCWARKPCLPGYCLRRRCSVAPCRMTLHAPISRAALLCAMRWARWMSGNR